MINKSIEQIENEFWGDAPKEATGLILKVHSLRKKKISELEPEDIRILIGQNIALETLIPLAITLLKENLFIECDYYEGDLLKSVLTSERNYWVKHQDKKQLIITLFEANKEILMNMDTTDDIKNGLLDSFIEFSS
jgi:hypothetical protein